MICNGFRVSRAEMVLSLYVCGGGGGGVSLGLE